MHALNQSRSLQTSPIAAVEGLPRMTQRHEQSIADGQLNVNADSALPCGVGSLSGEGLRTASAGAVLPCGRLVRRTSVTASSVMADSMK